MVSNAEDLCAEAGVDNLDELGGLLTDLKFEIIVRPDVGTGADLELYAPTKGRGQGEYRPLSWPELQQSMFDFVTLLEEEEEWRRSREKPNNPPVILPTLTSSQRLHLIQGQPWKYALGEFMASAGDGQYWSAPEHYAPGDLLLSVLKTQPPVLLCLERARTKPKGRSINVGAGGLYFDRLVPVHVIEQRAGVTLPHAPATVRKKVASAVLDAIATELSNPTDWLDPGIWPRPGVGCRIPTGIQAAALITAEGLCQACGSNYGALLGGRGIAALEVHDLYALANSSANTDDHEADPQAPLRAELSANTLAALRKLATAAGFDADEVSSANRDDIIESLIADEVGAVMDREDEMERFAVLCGGCHLLAHSVGSPSVETIRLAWRPACPRCGAHPPEAILWGLPAGPVDDPHVTYGGCVVDGDPAKWNCPDCGHQWGR